MKLLYFIARNRFNLKASTTEKPAESAGDNAEASDAASTTARSLTRNRPTLNLRGRSRSTTTKAPAAEGEAAEGATANEEEKPAAPATPVRPSRFNLNRAAGSRLPGRGKLGRTTEAPAATEDSAAEGSHHSEAAATGEGEAEKTESEAAAAAASPTLGGLNRLKNRPRLNTVHKTEASAKPKSSPVVAPRKLNPLLAKKRLQLGSSTTGKLKLMFKL